MATRATRTRQPHGELRKQVQSPLAAYRAIIDALTAKARESVSATFVVEEGIFSRGVGLDVLGKKLEPLNAFVQTLSKTQRKALAEALLSERATGIGEVLAELEWWMTCREVGLTFKGKPMPAEASEGPVGDYIGRMNGWEWPTS
jgi:hypothetical protein